MLAGGAIIAATIWLLGPKRGNLQTLRALTRACPNSGRHAYRFTLKAPDLVEPRATFSSSRCNRLLVS